MHCAVCGGTGTTPHGGVCYPCGGLRTRKGPKRVLYRNENPERVRNWFYANKYNNRFCGLELRTTTVIGWVNDAAEKPGH